MSAFLLRVIREPIVHFGVVAGLAFSVSQGSTDLERYEVRISAEHVRWLAEATARQRGSTPSSTELREALDRLIEEEIWVREALALGLGEGDPIVRRRLAQKMRFLAEDGAPEPGDDELSAYLQTHEDRYRVPEALRISQVFFRSDETEDEEIARARRRLQANPLASVGQPHGWGRDLGFLDRGELERRFGEDAKGIWTAPPGTWVGPVRSRFGLHLVQAVSVREARVPSLESVRARVRADAISDQRAAALADERARLRQLYSVEVEWPTETPAATVAARPRR